METKAYIRCALFAALTAAAAQIAIPIGPVPINLALLPVFLSGSLLGAKYGFLSQLAYLLLGACGLPVFTLFRGGLPVFAGPTGGYLWGYLLIALLAGRKRAGQNPAALALHMLMGLLALYALGSGWFMISTGSGFWETLGLCVLPFMPGDFLKIITACLVTKRLKGISED